MKAIVLAAAIAACSMTSSGIAQVAATAMTVGAAPTQGAMLKAGTSVPLRTLTELTTNGKKLHVGDRFQLETTDVVTVNGQVVIPAGSHAVGEVTGVRNKGMWGKSGNIDARLLYVEANDRRIRLSGTINDKGTTGTAGVVGAAVLIPVAGFFMTGTSAKIAANTPVSGFLEEDVPVAFAGAASAPMMVPAAPAAAADAAPVPSDDAPVAQVVPVAASGL